MDGGSESFSTAIRGPMSGNGAENPQKLLAKAVYRLKKFLANGHEKVSKKFRFG